MTTIRSAGVEAGIEARGAELCSLRDVEDREYLWQGDSRWWARRSPILFPIVGSFPDGSYEEGGRTYRMGNHGFARDRDFGLASSGPDHARFELRSDEASLGVYPWRFRLEVGCRAMARGVEVSWTVRNEDARLMPFSIGAHPGFRAPLEAGESRDDYELLFERGETAPRQLVNAANLRSGETAPFLEGGDRVALSSSLFERGAVVLADHASRAVTLRSRRTGRGVRVSFKGFPHLGIWSPANASTGAYDAPFVCIEPWYGLAHLASTPGRFEGKEGAIALPPCGLFEARYTIEIL